MSTLRPFSIYDIYKFNHVNLDILTETYSTDFYGKYIAIWGEYCVSSVNSTGDIEGYILGKVEGKEKLWHGHVTAVTVAPDYRKQGLARAFMDILEYVTTFIHNAYFVDLFVRSSNKVAIDMYKKLGYSTYRIVDKYYSDDTNQPAEDAFDMRKSMPRDVDKSSSIETGKKIKPEDLEFN
jgi:N-terminal acetyltransferase B complex catalytic subunit